MEDIKGYTSFGRIEPVTQGWSGNSKYYIETHQGEKLFLRLADIAYYSSKRHEFEMLEKVAALALPTPKPVDFGICEQGQSVYSLFTWCEGEDAELVLERLTAQEQYALGVQIGEYLRQIHSLPAPATAENWESRFGRKARAKIEAYAACPVKFPGDQYLIDYLQANWRLLKNRPQSFQHGGFHGGNMVIARDGKISLIDFNRCDYGDPWEEFNRIAFSVKASAEFASGQLHGYFGGEPPFLFFQLLAFYMASNALAAIPWAIPFGEKDVAYMLDLARDVLVWFDNMQNPIPTWYKPCLS